MGFYSWKTSDTKRSIANIHSCRDTFTVYVIWPDGSFEKEDNYGGYGVFGGIDIYKKIALLNGGKTRIDGIKWTCDNNLSGNFGTVNKKLILPKILENYSENYDQFDFPENCEYQGFFYPENDNEEYFDNDY